MKLPIHGNDWPHLYNRQEAGLSPFGWEDLKWPSEGSDIGQEKVLLSATAKRKELTV